MPTKQSAEERFRARVAELGGRVVGSYRNTKTPVNLVCAAGHECAPRPGNVLTGKGICGTCSGRDGSLAKAAFLARVTELGATALGPYAGANAPVSVQCGEGHVNDVYPGNVRKGHHVCQRCAARNDAAAVDFRNRVEALGGRLVGSYVSSGVPVEAVCVNGHTCHPRPNSVQQGGGLCGQCRGAIWDSFYLVQDPGTGYLKFGITSGDARPRLADHARDGYTSVLLVREGLPDGVARTVEKSCMSTAKAHGFAPVRGLEYFEGAAMVVLFPVLDRML